MAARWTPAEDRALRALYAEGRSLKAIALPLGRSVQAVGERRRALGIPTRARIRAWTATEDVLLRAAAAAGVPDSAVAHRLGRTDAQVGRRRRQLVGSRLSPRPFSADDDDKLRTCWVGGDVSALAHALGRSAASLRLRAQALGLHRPPPRRRWAAIEDTVVREGYEQGLSCAQISGQLMRRSAGAVAARAAKLGIATYARAWSQLDEHRLGVLVGEELPIESIAQAIGRTPRAVLLRSRKLGLALSASRGAARSGQRWTTEEDEVLRVHVALNPAVVSELLGRSSYAVTERMRRLGLSGGRSPHHPAARRGELTPGERVTAARELRTGGPARAFAVARRLDVSPTAIRAALPRSAAPVPAAMRRLAK